MPEEKTFTLTVTEKEAHRIIAALESKAINLQSFAHQSRSFVSRSRQLRTAMETEPHKQLPEWKLAEKITAQTREQS